MRMTNYERQKRWREKHRGLANLRRREAYKRDKGESVTTPAPVEVARPTQPKSKIEELRALMAVASAEPDHPTETVPMKPRVYRNDFGAVITESQWNELQRLKEKATQGGYEIDGYVQ